ncbi:hypothetical protein CRG98_043771 [Punica granatum]|uniref:Uncharacterized protein n=1 Tax=Punica granatum TaxID=22663 RepID=A0A2I0HVZ1_PUNGR|nr:hypothetical protein CRG98_043771 [Punica granatum]
MVDLRTVLCFCSRKKKHNQARPVIALINPARALKSHPKHFNASLEQGENGSGDRVGAARDGGVVVLAAAAIVAGQGGGFSDAGFEGGREGEAGEGGEGGAGGCGAGLRLGQK